MLSSFFNSSLFELIRATVMFFIALGVLVTVHEFGHFWVARRCGVKILRFSIGFGKPLWQKVDRNGTEFVIAQIPLGGYVKMLDERNEAETEQIPEQDRLNAFNNKSVWQRMAIVIAGPLANFLLTIFLFWIIYIIGVPSIRPIVPAVIPHSIAEKSGIKSGMEIVELNGYAIPDLSKLQLTILGLQGKTQTTAKVISPDMSEPQTINIALDNWSFNPEQDEPLGAFGIKLSSKASLKLTTVINNSAAQRAGFNVGDVIIKTNDQIMQDSGELAKIILQNPNKPLKIEVNRNNIQHTLYLTPETKVVNGKQIGFAGIGFSPDILSLAENRIVIRYNPVTAVVDAIGRTWQLSFTIVKEVGHMIAGDRSLQSLAGPLTIAKGAGQSASRGLVDYLMFLALLSINLGIVNLLPVPVLDGGHLVFLIVENVTGKPVSEKVLEYGTRMGLLVLMLLMGLSFFNDFSR